MRKETGMDLQSGIMQRGDGLCLVDVQIDFCPGGALPIEEGDRIIPVLNQWIEEALEAGIPVYASRDWHPVRHMSFKDQGGPWPPHCIQDTEGAAFHPDLRLPEGVIKITKGVRFDQDQNSVFDQTGLAAQLERDRVKRLWIGGLALDVCVLASVLDAVAAGFHAFLIREGTKPVTAEGGEEVLEKMRVAGAKIV
jgi:nicotinamidase/pyrazinamidase